MQCLLFVITKHPPSISLLYLSTYRSILYKFIYLGSNGLNNCCMDMVMSQKTNGCNTNEEVEVLGKLKGFGSPNNKANPRSPTKSLCYAVITHPIHWVNLCQFTLSHATHEMNRRRIDDVQVSPARLRCDAWNSFWPNLSGCCYRSMIFIVIFLSSRSP